jgi:hypothetical protein
MRLIVKERIGLFFQIERQKRVLPGFVLREETRSAGEKG